MEQNPAADIGEAVVGLGFYHSAVVARTDLAVGMLAPPPRAPTVVHSVPEANPSSTPYPNWVPVRGSMVPLTIPLSVVLVAQNPRTTPLDVACELEAGVPRALGPNKALPASVAAETPRSIPQPDRAVPQAAVVLEA